jgi:hypothetical protein
MMSILETTGQAPGDMQLMQNKIEEFEDLARRLKAPATTRSSAD